MIKSNRVNGFRVWETMVHTLCMARTKSCIMDRMEDVVRDRDAEKVWLVSWIVWIDISNRMVGLVWRGVS